MTDTPIYALMDLDLRTFLDEFDGLRAAVRRTRRSSRPSPSAARPSASSSSPTRGPVGRLVCGGADADADAFAA